MSERLINSAWRAVLITVIFFMGAGAMFQLYQGLLDLLGGRWEIAAAPLVVGAVMAGGIYWLARHREDLVEF